MHASEKRAQGVAPELRPIITTDTARTTRPHPAMRSAPGADVVGSRAVRDSVHAARARPAGTVRAEPDQTNQPLRYGPSSDKPLQMAVLGTPQEAIILVYSRPLEGAEK